MRGGDIFISFFFFFFFFFNGPLVMGEGVFASASIRPGSYNGQFAMEEGVKNIQVGKKEARHQGGEIQEGGSPSAGET